MVINTNKQSLLELLEGWHSIETDWPDVIDSVPEPLVEPEASVPQRFRTEVDNGIDQHVDD